MSSLGDFPTLEAPGATPKIRDIYKDFTAEALAQLKNHFASVDPIPTFISQILGYTANKARSGKVPTAEATTGTHTTYQSLATPLQITGLPDGEFALLYWATITATAGAAAGLMSPKYGTAEAVDADAAQAVAAGTLGVIIGALPSARLTSGNNTILMRHRASANFAVTFAQRGVLAIRLANA